MIFRKSIFTAASPNTQLDDVIETVKMLFTPWRWNDIEINAKFKFALSGMLKVEYVHLIDSGRSALQIGLKTLEIKEGDEVVIPSFTCVVVANAVHYTGATPVYIDANENDFNGDYENIEKYITEKTKAVVVQHTFGKIVDTQMVIDKLAAINRTDIYVLEDFAHVIKEDIDLKGTFGFLTFGIEKVISSVRGGAIITHDEKLSALVEANIKELPDFPTGHLIKSLLNPIFWYIAIPLHSVGLGRYSVGAMIRTVWRKLGFLGIMVEGIENKAIKPDWFPAKMSPALSKLGLKQLLKLNKFNAHRTTIAKIYHLHLSEISDSEAYEDGRVYLRYPILLDNKEDFTKVWDYSRSIRVTLGNWFDKPLYGAGVDSETYKKLCFVAAENPVTMKKAGLTLNLPTSVNISQERARELAEGIKEQLSGIN